MAELESPPSLRRRARRAGCRPRPAGPAGRRHRQFRRRASRPPRGDRHGDGARPGGAPAGGGADLRAASAHLFRPDEPSFHLTSEAAKLRLLAATGLDGAIVLTFNAALAGLSAEEFVERILVDRLAISGAVIGFNFHFGKAAAARRNSWWRKAPTTAFRSMWCRRSSTRAAASPPARSAMRWRPATSTRRPSCSAIRISSPRGRARRQARADARLSDRQSAARSRLRPQARHLCGAGRRRRHAL